MGFSLMPPCPNFSPKLCQNICNFVQKNKFDSTKLEKLDFECKKYFIKGLKFWTKITNYLQKFSKNFGHSLIPFFIQILI